MMSFFIFFLLENMTSRYYEQNIVWCSQYIVVLLNDVGILVESYNNNKNKKKDIISFNIYFNFYLSKH